MLETIVEVRKYCPEELRRGEIGGSVLKSSELERLSSLDDVQFFELGKCSA